MSDCLYKSICCGYSFELHQQADAIQMGIHNICLYNVHRKYPGCNLKTTKLLDCMLIRVCAVIRANTVYSKQSYHEHLYRGSSVYINEKNGTTVLLTSLGKMLFA